MIFEVRKEQTTGLRTLLWRRGEGGGDGCELCLPLATPRSGERTRNRCGGLQRGIRGILLIMRAAQQWDGILGAMRASGSGNM